MKYKRLTKRIADEEEAFLFHSSLHEGIERLAELEDKIESGELVEVPKGAVVLTPEERDEEMRLANEERKQAVKEFAEEGKRMICCSCGKEIDINYGREYWNGIYCKKCAYEMLSTPEYIKNYKRIIADLQAENAVLRERLDKAITPEFKIYEDVYFIDYVDEKGYSDHTTGKPKIREAFITCVSQVMQTEFLYRLQPKDLPQEILNDSTIHEEWWDGQHYYAKEIFKTFEAALARLAELEGE